jgi:DUF4097 and DUF4098 domain-containing protein YvlB
MTSASIWRAIAAAFTVGIVIAGVLVTWSLLRPRGDVHTEPSTGTYNRPVSRLEFVDFEASDIAVVAGVDNEVRITRSLRWTGDTRPEFDEVWADDQLTISHHCGNADSDDCSIRYTITVPRAITLKAETSAGDVSVRGVLGEIEISVVSGDVNMIGSAGNVTLTSVSGDIKVTESTSDSSMLKAVSGDVSIRFTDTPREVAVETVSGDSNVTVPAGSGAYTVNVVTTSGDQRVSVQRGDVAERAILVESTSGDVTVAYT